jgi:hypothetical protein
MGFRVMRTGTSVTVTEEKRNGDRTMRYAGDVQGSFIWPTPLTPAYGLIMAQLSFHEKGKFPLVLLKEISDRRPTHFFKELFHQAQGLSCRDFYAEILGPPENRDLVSMFNDHARYHSQVSINLKPAPKNWEFAFPLIEEWTEADALEVQENTILAAQLERAGQEDLGNAEQTLFAVKALSFLVSSVEQEPWSAPNFFPGGGRSRLRGIL